MTILIKNANIVTDAVKLQDILIVDGVIAKIDSEIKDKADKAFDVKGKTVLSSFVDMHCHLRDPGFTGKEDIASGSCSAVKGGFSDICCMPNTNPVTDNAIIVEYINKKAEAVNLARVHVVGSATKGQNGKELSEIGLMKQAGIIAISDDGKPVEDAKTMKLCMQYASDFGLKVLSHCEVTSLTDGGVVNEGKNALITGLRGISKASEEVMIARDIVLANNLNLPVHLCHVSTKGGVELIRDAKRRGVRVTAETCPHYFSATDDMILTYDTFSKVNPPLRESEDVVAIKQGIEDGTIDVIATDHAPHKLEEKAQQFDFAPFGISGFETAFSLTFTNLVKTGVIDIVKLNKVMSLKASEILGLAPNIIKQGHRANLVVADLDASYTINGNEFVSKGKNTPFNGQQVYGKVIMTMVNGDIKYVEERAL